MAHRKKQKYNVAHFDTKLITCITCHPEQVPVKTYIVKKNNATSIKKKKS